MRVPPGGQARPGDRPGDDPWDSRALRLLLGALPAPPADTHPVDIGTLGEYLDVERRHGEPVAADDYPIVAAHLHADCQRCHQDLADLRALARLASQAPAQTGPRHRAAPRGPDAAPRAFHGGGPSAGLTAAPEPSAPTGSDAAPDRAEDAGAATRPADTGPAMPSEPAPEPLELLAASALSRQLEQERDALLLPLPRDRSGRPEAARLVSARQARRRRQVALVEAALVRQRVSARRLFLARADAATTPGQDLPRRPLNPKARLLFDDLADAIDELGRLSGRIGRLTGELCRLGDDPRGPARSQAEALLDRLAPLARDALALDRRLARLQGALAGMVT